jgi:hypothetical protein
MKTVLITEKKTGTAVATIPMTLRGLTYTPSERECFDLAWRDAVSDGLVAAEYRQDYAFSLIDG